MPDWKLIMIKPPDRLPSNIVMFKTDVRMTEWDIRNYLEKIYKVPVGAVTSRIMTGDLKASKSGLTKKDDYRIAHVTLTAGQRFEWPDLFPQHKTREQVDDYEKTLKELTKERQVKPDQVGLPTWFA